MTAFEYECIKAARRNFAKDDASDTCEHHWENGMQILTLLMSTDIDKNKKLQALIELTSKN